MPVSERLSPKLIALITKLFPAVGDIVVSRYFVESNNPIDQDSAVAPFVPNPKVVTPEEAVKRPALTFEATPEGVPSVERTHEERLTALTAETDKTANTSNANNEKTFVKFILCCNSPINRVFKDFYVKRTTLTFCGLG